MNLKNIWRRLALVGMLGVALVALVACSDAEEDSDASATESATVAATASATVAATESATVSATEVATEAATEVGGMEVTDAWARATAGNPGENTAIYALLTNDGGEDDLLIAVRVGEEIAMRTEVHEMVRQGDNMVMQEVAGGLPVAGAAQTALQPGGYHVMLMSVPSQLTVGQTFSATFVFEKAGEVQVEVEVREASSTGAMGGMNP